MCLNLCGASHYPMTKLFGRSPAGMNATGESDLRNYYDYVDSQREAKLRPVLEKLLPVLAMSAWGAVPEDLQIDFPPLWTPTAKEVADIARAKAEAIVSTYQAGLLNVDTAQKELKKLEGETGLWGSLTDGEIKANQGRTYQDATALRDPLVGLGFETPETETGEEETGPFETIAWDAIIMDYPGQPREKNGRFAEGKMLTSSGESGTLQSSQKVALPDGGTSKLTDGTKITKIVVFAGKGTSKELRASGRLSKEYGQPSDRWKKVRGDGYVDFEGESRHCELHWYEAPGTGRIELKVKRWFDDEG